ncbi:MAG: peptide deformylase [Trichlorobacter sp.]|uniref:peptide deformylase n=1 Tax=Trichlorobacter sp. TaxID=2911007 RepID=UPI00256A7540|nr:peptide deformylase [Trichlorobacter sp.]MDK9717635.1 peptide deformylase [Trichlorobacter sp.]
MGQILTIHTIGNPLLRRKAAKVGDPQDPKLAVLVDNMLTTMLASDGVGIAAPQISQLLRVVIVASRPNPRYPDAPQMEPVIMVNPIILSRSSGQEEGLEGCLSVPGKKCLIMRHQAVEVCWHDLEAKRHQQSFSGFVARIVQHEVDHLEGILYPDRAGSSG